MKLVIYICLFSMYLFAPLVSYAEEDINENKSALPIVKLDKANDNMYSGEDVRNNLSVSEEEKMDDLNSDLDFDEQKIQLPELSCSSSNLKAQTIDFLLKSTDEKDPELVIAKRKRLLSIKNINDFIDVTDKKMNDKWSYYAYMTMSHLRINDNKKVYKLCYSHNDVNSAYEDLYVVIYQNFKYYKVVVANLALTTEQINDATFVYNW